MNKNHNFKTEKILITGAKGQLGYDIVKVLKEKNINFLGIDINDADITKLDEVERIVLNYKPTTIIHTAAYTNVDKAEKEKEKCYEINVLGTQNLALSAKKVNAKFIYFSSDYVFDGKGNIPFNTSNTPNPINYYGYSKYCGELEVINNLKEYFIIRISWVFGINGNNFVKTMLKLFKEKAEINVVSDQIGSPTYTKDLSYMILNFLNSYEYGIYHITNDGYISWYDFALEIKKQVKSQVKINKVLSINYKSDASRPLNSRLSKGKYTLRNYKDALFDFLKEVEKNV